MAHGSAWPTPTFPLSSDSPRYCPPACTAFTRRHDAQLILALMIICAPWTYRPIIVSSATLPPKNGRLV
ncbi:hypothetical protein GGR94_003484 [Sulfitobacter geojensis]|nr:hypothetical protein [Sulfitobacter geojensis]